MNIFKLKYFLNFPESIVIKKTKNTIKLFELNLIISKNNFFKNLDKKTNNFVKNLKEIADNHKFDFNCDSTGGMFGIYFSKNKPKDIDDVKKSDLKMFNMFFKYMLDNGIFFAPSAFEAGFISQAHSEKDFKKVYKTFDSFLKNL